MPKSKSKEKKSGGPPASALSSWVSILSLMDEKKAKEPLLRPPPPSEDYVYPASAFPPLSTFDVELKVPALIIPAKRTNELRKQLKGIMLQRPRLKVVVEVLESDQEQLPMDPDNVTRKRLPENQCRMLVLDPHQVPLVDVVNTPPLPIPEPPHVLLKPLLVSHQATMSVHTIHLKYQDWTVDEVLRRLLPPSLEIPSAFEVVGTLAHMNLREEQLPYKYMIGKVLLDKHQPSLKTIVNKLGSIDSKYRTFGMEVIAGNAEGNWSEVQVKEEGCLYRLDFQKVYWNSRLGGEHRRLVKEIRKDFSIKKRQVVVADLMAGIGPFAVPLTATTLKANQVLCDNELLNGGDDTEYSEPPIICHANDLNPASYKYLEINHKTNKCGSALQMYNMDGRAFCHQLQDQGIVVDHVIMNLPASALEFLDAFRGYKVKSDSNGGNSNHMPIIHVYCFAPKNMEEARQAIYERAEKALGCSLSDTDVSIYEVRDVAPNKNMYCVTFQLPTAVQALPRVETTSPDDESNGEAEPEQKRQKVNE